MLLDLLVCGCLWFVSCLWWCWVGGLGCLVVLWLIVLVGFAVSGWLVLLVVSFLAMFVVLNSVDLAILSFSVGWCASCLVVYWWYACIGVYCCL